MRYVRNSKGAQVVSFAKATTCCGQNSLSDGKWVPCTEGDNTEACSCTCHDPKARLERKRRVRGY